MPANRLEESRAALHLAPCLDGNTPSLRIGGPPKMPENLDWPTGTDSHSMHFFAALDFARIPKSDVKGNLSAIPTCPDEETCFIFLDMLAHEADALDARVLFCRQSVDDVSARPLPADLKVMRSSSQYMDPDRLSDCGRMFLPSNHLLVHAPASLRPYGTQPQQEPPRSLPALLAAVMNDREQHLTRHSAFALASSMASLC